MIKPGTPIAVMAPAGIYDTDQLERGLAIAQRVAKHTEKKIIDQVNKGSQRCID